MKRNIATICLLFICTAIYAQMLDLIVTNDGDSVACKIGNITQSTIYFKMKVLKGYWTETTYPIDQIKEYKYDCIDSDDYLFEKGSSRIISAKSGIKYSEIKYPGNKNLGNSTMGELDLYLAKAMRQRKTGKIMVIAGPVSFGTGILLWTTAWSGGSETMLGTGSVLLLAGTASTLIGIPVLAVGSSRVNAIKKQKQLAMSGIEIELTPLIRQNMISQQQDVGLTLRVNF